MLYVLLGLSSVQTILLAVLVGLRLHHKHKEWPDTRTRGFGIVTDLGQGTPEEPRGNPSGLTEDELEWAYELGATTIDEAVDLVRKHEETKR
jgi:hypothetical protein